MARKSKLTAIRLTIAARPFVTTLGAVVLLAILVATISLTRQDLQWTAFLCGVLSAAIIAFVSYMANARSVIASRTAQLKAAEERIAGEAQMRAQAEKRLARLGRAAQMIDETLPAMLAYVDVDKRVRYHNRAFARWTGNAGDAIDGQRLEDIMDRPAYAAIDERLQNAFDGHNVHYESTLAAASGDACRLHVQLLPRHGKQRKVAGVFAILTDISHAGQVERAPSPATTRPEAPVALAIPDSDAGAGERLISALEHNEFSLHCQPIAALRKGGGETTFCEVLLRMQEEEDLQLPPGTFLPVAEALGLLHLVDRWVVRHVVAHAATAKAQRNAVYFVNLSAPTIRDAGFGDFVRECLQGVRVPDHTLCFELPEAEVLADPAAYRRFTDSLEGTGCRFAVSGSACESESMRSLQELRVDFLKLDGGIVLDMLRTPAGLARVKAINVAAHAAGMRTVAECVESDTARAALTRIGIDFAQGFGIGMPRPIRALDEELAAAEAARELESAAA